jgi:hypothetical protein
MFKRNGYDRSDRFPVILQAPWNEPGVNGPFRISAFNPANHRL